MNKIYETVIGVEVHVELKTKSKLFCSCKTEYGAPPNSQSCPICAGFPGTLPTVNKNAVYFAIKAGLATCCNISNICKFDRKNYFYPDLPKAYQISQYDIPICKNGYVRINLNGNQKDIGITRIHLEEDAGKLIHDQSDGTLIDLNRAGIPLIEIVTEPDMRSAEEVIAFLKKLRLTLLYTGISDCKMNEGSMRCDVNLSVRKKGETTLGVRTEIKNLNSFAFIAKAIEAEAKRQISILDAGNDVTSVTVRYDTQSGLTYPMRKKEHQEDYRFIRDPDIPIIKLDHSEINKIKSSLPMLPDEKMHCYCEIYRIPNSSAETIISDINVSRFFDEILGCVNDPATAATLVISEFPAFEELRYACTPEHFASLSNLLSDRKINSSTSKKLLKMLIEKDFDPEKYVTENSLLQITSESEVRSAVISALKDNKKVVADYISGKSSAYKSIYGYAMKLTCGKADPLILDAILKKELGYIG